MFRLWSIAIGLVLLLANPMMGQADSEENPFCDFHGSCYDWVLDPITTSSATADQYKTMVEACGVDLPFAQQDQVTQLRYHFIYHDLSNCVSAPEGAVAPICSSHIVDPATKSCTQEFYLAAHAQFVDDYMKLQPKHLLGKASERPMISRQADGSYLVIYEWPKELRLRKWP